MRKFYPLTETVLDDATLDQEFKDARQIGPCRIGETCLMIRSKLKNYYVPYSDVTRFYRRVKIVKARVCCGRGEMEMEHLVVCGEQGELAEVQVPGTRAAVGLMDALKAVMPEVEAVKP